jgi:hypothetical protein
MNINKKEEKYSIEYKNNKSIFNNDFDGTIKNSSKGSSDNYFITNNTYNNTVSQTGIDPYTNQNLFNINKTEEKLQNNHKLASFI